MTELPANLVIRRARPRRMLVLASVAVILGVVALYAAFELGRYDGGYDMLAATRQRSQLDETVGRLEQANGALRKQLAQLDTMRVGGTQERAELAHTIGELQSQVASQSQQLEFYRGVVSHGLSRDDLAIGLKIQELRVTAEGPAAGHFEVHLTLLQTARPQAAVSGTFRLSVEGQMQGKSETLDLAALGSKLPEQPFSFRYFQSIAQEIVVPSGFSPERLTVEVRAGKQPVTPLIQTFPWRVEAP
jgi:hypothetical protein